LGAVILLLSVTKSAIKPPEVAGNADIPLTSSIPTTITMDSNNPAPREAALSQIDMLSPSMSGNMFTPEVQIEMANLLRGEGSNTEINLTVKSIPKTAPRVEANRDQKGNVSIGLQARASSFDLAFIH